MRNIVLFLLLPIVFLPGCKMEPSGNGEPFANPFISEEFDFVTTSFNINTFNSQRSHGKNGIISVIGMSCLYAPDVTGRTIFRNPSIFIGRILLSKKEKSR